LVEYFDKNYEFYKAVFKENQQPDVRHSLDITPSPIPIKIYVSGVFLFALFRIGHTEEAASDWTRSQST